MDDDSFSSDDDFSNSDIAEDVLEDEFNSDLDELEHHTVQDSYSYYWDNPGFEYWRDDHAEDIPLFDNTPVFCPVSQTQRTDAVAGAPSAQHDAPSTCSDSNMSTENDDSSDDKLAALDQLLASCKSEDIDLLSTAAQCYMLLDPPAVNFLLQYLQPPQWALLEKFLSQRKDWIIQHRGRSTVAKPSTLSKSEYLLQVSPVGLLTTKDVRAQLEGKAAILKATVAYIDGCTQGFAALRISDESAQVSLQQELQGVSFDGLSACTCRPIPADDPVRRALYDESTTKRPSCTPPAAPVQTKKQQIIAKQLAHEHSIQSLCSLLQASGVDKCPVFVIDFEAALTGSTFSLPTEVCIAEYSMRCGFAKVFHCFIHPGHIPNPWDIHAMEVCVNYPPTGIPFRNFSLAEYDYQAIWKQITEMIPKDAKLIAKGVKVECDSLQWLADRAGAVQDYSVLDLTDLLKALAHAHGNELTDEQVTALARVHQSYLFPDTCCEYHQWLAEADPEKSYHCAKQDVYSYCYSLNRIVNDHFPNLVDRSLPLVDSLPNLSSAN